jgi:hypothetical protein
LEADEKFPLSDCVWTLIEKCWLRQPERPSIAEVAAVFDVLEHTKDSIQRHTPLSEVVASSERDGSIGVPSEIASVDDKFGPPHFIWVPVTVDTEAGRWYRLHYVVAWTHVY